MFFVYGVKNDAPSAHAEEKVLLSQTCSVLTATRFFSSILDRNIFIRYNMFIGSYIRRNYE